MRTLLILLLTFSTLFSYSQRVKELKTAVMPVTNSPWNYVISWPQGPLTGKYPVIISLPGAGENGTDTALLLGPNSIDYWFKNGWNGKVFGEDMIVVFVQSRTSSFVGNNFSPVFDTAMKFISPYADTNRVYLTGLSRGAGQWARKSTTDFGSSRVWQATANLFLSTGIAENPGAGYDSFIAMGGRYFMTIGYSAADSGSYTFTMNLKRRMDVLYPNTVAVYGIPGGGHGGWQTEYNPATKRFNGLNLYENAFTVSKKPYASAPSPVINLPLGTTSMSLTGITKQYNTPQAFNGRNVSFLWTKVSGPSCTINTPTSPAPNVTGMTNGTYLFRFTSTNAAGGQSASYDVTVNIGGENPVIGSFPKIIKFVQ